jgi:hypothetical protein
MWKTRGRYFLTKDPMYVITSVSTFKFLNDFKDLNTTYKIDKLESDKTYRDLYSYCELRNGCDFIPIAFSDRVPKLNRLSKVGDLHWCIGYISPYFVGGNKSLMKSCGREITSPSYELLLSWFKYHVNNYNSSADNYINQKLAEYCLVAYVNKIKDEHSISKNRLFKLIYNNKVVFNKSGNCLEWIEHLENLPNRDFYEIVVNDFE